MGGVSRHSPFEQSSIMIDFIEATICLDKDTPNLGHCKPFPCKLNQVGWETYTLQGCREMEVHWRPDASLLKVKGSLPYFIQGHNFSFSNADFVEGVEVLQSILGVGLWPSYLDAFEYGCIFKVDGKPAEYIRNHTSQPYSKLYINERGKDKGAFRWWGDSTKSLKLYDAGKNIKMKQGLKEREVIQKCGYDPECNYLKFEVHWNKPQLLNSGRGIVLENLQNPEWIGTLSATLIEQYKLLKPMRTLQQPISKKDLSAIDIAVNVLVESMMEQGIPIEETRKQVYAYINGARCLDKRDKDARKATFRRAFGRLKESEVSQWDLTSKIEEALAVEV